MALNNYYVNYNSFYDEFRIWYEDSFGNNKYPSKIEFGKYLKKKYPKNYIGKELRRFKKKNKNSIITNGNLKPSENLNLTIAENLNIPENLNLATTENSNINLNVTENNTKKSKDPNSSNIGY